MSRVTITEEPIARKPFDCPPTGAASDCALCPDRTKRRCIPPVIDAERANAALVMVKQLKGRSA